MYDDGTEQFISAYWSCPVPSANLAPGEPVHWKDLDMWQLLGREKLDTVTLTVTPGTAYAELSCWAAFPDGTPAEDARIPYDIKGLSYRLIQD